MGCGSSKNVVLQQNSSREHLVSLDVLSQGSFVSIHPEREYDNAMKNNSLVSPTDVAQEVPYTNVCDSATNSEALQNILYLNHKPLEVSVSTQPQASNMHASSKEHGPIMTSDQSGVVNTDSTESNNDVSDSEEASQSKCDENDTFPACCLNRDANSCVADRCGDCTEYKGDVQVAVGDYGGGNISQTSSAIDEFDRLVNHPAVSINEPFSIGHLHWQKDAYSMSQSHRIQALQLQLGFIGKVTVSGGNMCTPFGSEKVLEEIGWLQFKCPAKINNSRL